ncbi:helix-turn-helix domain-containing protein [Chishuiella sp.]|uniref:helix-turn-helix domain-containing protein n=1 Tax=Chishuiella sp. TaxID=1969467 RepID=UPI0028B1FF83|nr:helix-turn-helix domain-containing protein [Chishuiella sp.]
MRVSELNIDTKRIINFFKNKYTEEQILEQYEKKSIDSNDLLKWSKLLEYDFFRIYSQHIILFAPLSKEINKDSKKDSKLPQFKKNIYTIEIIEFVLDIYKNENKTIQEISKEYNIPKNTIRNWINKYL